MFRVSAQLRRGRFFSRSVGRAVREAQALLTTAVLTCTRPQPTQATIVSLNADEENATVQVILLGMSGRFKSLTLVTPCEETASIAVQLAARRLNLPVPQNLRHLKLNYLTLLREYKNSAETYSTHILLPGRDHSRSRRHVHLTHGSGPKPDTTFRSPANALASITPRWTRQQLQEYKMPPDAEVIAYMPRLEIMQRAIGDAVVLAKLGVDPAGGLVVWAPTYRKTIRGGELRVSGVPVTDAKNSLLLKQVQEIADKENAPIVLKVHPHDADNYAELGFATHTNESLRTLGITPYELFGAASLLITDYSSVYLEREFLGLPYILVQPDHAEFSTSPRGLR